MAQYKLAYLNRNFKVKKYPVLRNRYSSMYWFYKKRKLQNPWKQIEKNYMMPRKYTTFERKQLRDFERDLFSGLLKYENNK